jgi:hypothetical protein
MEEVFFRLFYISKDEERDKQDCCTLTSMISNSIRMLAKTKDNT